MYKDAEEELQRLEEALLEEEIPEELPEESAGEQFSEEPKPEADLAATRRIESVEEAEALTPDLAATRRIYNADQLDVNLEEYAQQVQEETGHLTGLIITAAVLAAGVIGILVWWLVRYGALL